jgi:hypothetical protein
MSVKEVLSADQYMEAASDRDSELGRTQCVPMPEDYKPLEQIKVIPMHPPGKVLYMAGVNPARSASLNELMTQFFDFASKVIDLEKSYPNDADFGAQVRSLLNSNYPNRA